MIVFPFSIEVGDWRFTSCRGGYRFRSVRVPVVSQVFWGAS